MTGRIGEDPRPAGLVGLVIGLARAQLQQPGLGLVQVRDVEAEVELLGNGLAGRGAGARDHGRVAGTRGAAIGAQYALRVEYGDERLEAGARFWIIRSSVLGNVSGNIPMPETDPHG
jgi:hypothetical protein